MNGWVCCWIDEGWVRWIFGCMDECLNKRIDGSYDHNHHHLLLLTFDIIL